MSENGNFPLPPLVIPENLIQAAINNFNHEEGNPSWIAGSHDTIISYLKTTNNAREKFDFNISYKQKSLTCILPCQILNKYKLIKRAEIPTNFTITERLEISNVVNLRNSDNLFWVLKVGI